jgi:hypothetical protein
MGIWRPTYISAIGSDRHKCQVSSSVEWGQPELLGIYYAYVSSF